MRTKKNTPTAANVTFAGEYSCLTYEECGSRTSSCHEAYQTNALFKGSRKGIQDFHSRNEPLGPSIIATSGLIWPLDMPLKDCENGGGRIADLEFRGEWVGE